MTAVSTCTPVLSSTYGALSHALKMTAATVAGAKRLPAINGQVRVRIADGVAEIAATDYSSTVQITLPDHASGDATFLVDHGQFTKMLTALGKGVSRRDVAGLEVTIRLTSDHAVIECADYALSLATGSPDGFPTLSPQEPPVTSHVLDREAFTDLVKQVSPCLCRDPLLPALNGVHLHAQEGTLTLTATDRYRAGRAQMPAAGTGDTQMVLPGAGLTAVLKHLHGDTLSIGCDTHWGVVRTDNVTVAFQLPDSEFPRVQHLFDADPRITVTVPRAHLAQAATRVAGINQATNPTERAARLVITPHTLTLLPTHSTAAPTIPATVACHTPDEPNNPFTIGVNSDYLAQALSTFTGDHVHLCFRAPNQAFYLQDPDIDYRHLIMSLRLPQA